MSIAVSGLEKFRNRVRLRRARIMTNAMTRSRMLLIKPRDDDDDDDDDDDVEPRENPRFIKGFLVLGRYLLGIFCGRCIVFYDCFCF
mmetsp:Transcript_4250/g.6230  ORF Transcript_4250/g.6230 Transcript_4250/m.6230 type:complete len:87 (+) Transcript_4250:1899-2159(+)